nr:nibrin [Quercus suber]
MWILSCDGELWGGRRRWLRPGSRHLLGRTHSREPGHRVESIDDKSVSRKHAIIAVSHVSISDSGLLQSRTAVTVTDDSKIGTQINGEKVHKTTITLSNSQEFTIKLGSYKHVFRLKWQPVVLTLAHLSSKTKEHGLLKAKQLFEGSDVKLMLEYVPGHTTHLVANKRNTVAALQALTQACWLVAVQFVDKLANAVASGELDDNSEPAPCPLEIEFDVNFPNEMDMPAPSGSRELVKRPGSYLMPQRARAEVFQDYLFVFMSQIQFDTLMPAVTSGGGKAVLWDVIPHESEVKDFVDYVKDLAGETENHDFKLSQQTKKGGIVAVRLGDKSDEWVVNFLTDVEITLDQRSIEQGEFLDAILTVDASDLRRPLKDAESVTGSLPPRSSPIEPQVTRMTGQHGMIKSPTTLSRQQPVTEQQTSLGPQTELCEPDPVSMAKKRGRRNMTQSRLKRFDDDDEEAEEDDGGMIRTVQSMEHSVSCQPSYHQSRQAQAQGQTNDLGDMEIDQPKQTEESHSKARKRPAVAEVESDEDLFHNMLEGQAAMKRLKLSAATQRDSSNSKPDIDVGKGKALLNVKKKPKQRDLMAELQMKREKEEEHRRKDEESLRFIADGIEISKLRDVAKIEGMDIPVRDKTTHSNVEHQRSARWDPAWDGRKNFKKFRPQGQSGERPGPKRVIVTLEEVPRKGHGIGEEYWQSIPSHTSSGKSKAQSQSESQVVRESRAGSPNGSTEEDVRFRRRLQRSREDDAEDSRIIPEEIAGTARDQDLQAKAYSTQPDTLVAATQRGVTGKRLAVMQAGPPAKKLKQSAILPVTKASTRVVIDDDDDDDGLKFKRKRR